MDGDPVDERMHWQGKRRVKKSANIEREERQRELARKSRKVKRLCFVPPEKNLNGPSMHVPKDGPKHSAG
jgi:hypothetical protein